MGCKVFGVLRFWGLGFISGVWGTVEGFILRFPTFCIQGLVCWCVSQFLRPKWEFPKTEGLNIVP